MSEPNSNTNTNNNQPASQAQNQPQGQGNMQQPAFDYEKLANLINGKQTVTEDTVLKSYFKEQGLSPDEAKQAISAFKEQKAKNTPDVTQLQNDLTLAQKARVQAEVDKSATLEAIKLGINANTIPYVLKLADLSNVVENDSINTEKITEAINKVLEDVPSLKENIKNDDNNGFSKIGGDGNSQNVNTNTTKATVPSKKWNKFNN